MSSSEKADAELLDLAKKQLRLADTDPVPELPVHYVKELKKHVGIFPNDTNFYIIPKTGRGFGDIICLEAGCNSDKIKLSATSFASDGGRKDGVGSLGSYRIHINNHPAHKASRNERLSRSSSVMNRSRSNGSNNNSSDSGFQTGKSGLKLLSVIDRTGSPCMPSAPSGSSLTSSHTDPVSHSTQPSETMSSDPKKRVSESSPENGSDVWMSDQNMLTPTPVAMARSTAKPKVIKGKAKIPFAIHDDNRPSQSLPTLEIEPSQHPVLTPPSMAVAGTLAPSISQIETEEQLGRTVNELTLLKGQLVHWATESNTSDTKALAIQTIEWRIAELQSVEQQCRAVLTASGAQFGQLAPDLASGSRLQLPDIIGSRQTQLAHDPMFQTMSRPSAASGSFNSASRQVVPSSVGPLCDNDDDDVNPYARGESGIRDRSRTEGLDEFFRNAGNAEQFDSNASVAEALKHLNLPNLAMPLPGLTVVLMPHQVIGVAWMLKKEGSSLKGGILSDEMGLGKTVQMIATMMVNRSEDPANKTTLIILPLALLDQWKLEIEMKTNVNFRVLVYHGQEKAKTRRQLQKADVVLTTYGTLTSEWCDLEAEAERKRKEKESSGRKRKSKDDFFISDDEYSFSKKKRKKSGLLFGMTWYRVVLDEAQKIQNKRTNISRAVTELDTTYRWCLTGTPITNTLDDAFGLFRFLELRPWYDWEAFYPHISKPSKRSPELATIRLQAIFATCLLRRRKDSELDGKKLIELPPKDVQLIQLKFIPEEDEIYRALETRSQIKFNRYLRAGTVLKNYVHVLVLLLRLRQICTHTSLITEEDGVIVDDEFEYMEADKRDEIIKAQIELGREFIDEVKAKLRDDALERMNAEKISPDAEVVNEECPVCFDLFTDPVVTRCKHFFCRDCIERILTTPGLDDGDGRKADGRPCPVCRDLVRRDQLFSRAAFEPTDEELSVNKDSQNLEDDGAKDSVKDEDADLPSIAMLLDSSSSKRKSKRKSRGQVRMPAKKRAKRVVMDSDTEKDDEEAEAEEEEEEEEEEEDDDDLSDFIVQDGENEEEKDARRILKKRLGKRRISMSSVGSEDDDRIVFGRKKPVVTSNYNTPIRTLSKLLPSTKMKYMMDTLMKWSEEHPNEKTIVISQWTQALDLVSNYLETKGFLHVKFQGSMSREMREKAVRKFMRGRDAKVMLMSLKCGGVGLNLTRGNRVISLDLGWSEAVESQAFDRVHRLGQTRPVFVQRLVISNTVEDRVLALQERKRNLADGSLGEGAGKKIGRLSVRELANLFGLDQNGNRLQA